MTNQSAAITDLEYADKLWQAADKLRGQVDAAEYKHVVLGLLFLKYISDLVRGHAVRNSKLNWKPKGSLMRNATAC